MKLKPSSRGWPAAVVAVTSMSVAVLGGCSTGLSDEATKAALKSADTIEINNVMSLHSWYHAAMQNSVEVDRIWSKRPDIVLARNSGYWQGESVRKYYGEKVGEPFTTGAFVWHVLTTGVVEVAGDRQTAKGVWYTPGAGGHATGAGDKHLDWMWEKYGVDFVREDGHWKVWHMRVYTDWTGDANVNFNAGMGAPPPGAVPSAMAPGAIPHAPGPSGKGAETRSAAARKDAEVGVMPAGPAPGVAMPASLSASDDVRWTHGYEGWNGKSAPQLRPRPPEPYQTFSQTWSYADENE